MITIKQAKDIIEYVIDHNLKKSLLFLGASGIGKSEVIQQIATKRDMKVIDIRLVTWSLTDIKGIPVPDDSKTYTKWLINEVLPTVEKDGERGILLFEEIMSAPRSVQAAAYQLILDRKIMNYEVPAGWDIIATGNREEDDGIFVKMPAPLANRFEIHEVDVDFDTWKYNYAIPYDIESNVLAYLEFNPKSIHTFSIESDEMVFASPRSWKTVSDIIKTVDLSEEIPDIIFNMVRGNIGELETSSFKEFLSIRKDVPSIESILNGTAKQKIKALKIQYIIVSNLVQYINKLYKFMDEKHENRIKMAMKRAIEYTYGFSVELSVLLVRGFLAIDKDFVSGFIVNDMNTNVMKDLTTELNKLMLK